MEMIFEECAMDLIVNTDETSWKLIDNCTVTVADRGVEGVVCEFERNVKVCMMVMASIDTVWSKFPLWIICRGKTHRCEASLRG
jgi:hypothetical protein